MQVLFWGIFSMDFLFSENESSSDTYVFQSAETLLPKYLPLLYLKQRMADTREGC